MGVEILSQEDATPYRAFYHRVLEVLAEETDEEWAVQFFHYDNLVLINVDAWRTIGQWDVFILYYGTDCDAYCRMRMHGLASIDVSAGYIWDVSDVVSSPEARFFFPISLRAQSNMELSIQNDTTPSITEQDLNSARPQPLRKKFEEMQNSRIESSDGKNT